MDFKYVAGSENKEYLNYYLQRGKAAFPPPCMPLSRGGLGGRSPPNTTSGLSSKLNFIENPASKNCEKMVEFFDEILAQMLQNRDLEGVWAPPWGRFWKVLGGFWAVLGSKRPLG